MLKTAYQQALAWLARREYSVRELDSKLETKGYDSKERCAAIAALQEERALDEERFLGCFIRTRISQGFGPLRILNELAEHAIEKATVKAHEDWQKADWIKLAYHIRDRRFGSILPTEFPIKAKQMQFLQRRGFESDQIHVLFSKHDELSF